MMVASASTHGPIMDDFPLLDGRSGVGSYTGSLCIGDDVKTTFGQVATG
jgi:hypothetical protein